MAHVVHFAVLNFPNRIVQDPNIVASIKDAPRLGRIVESTLDPVRVSDAVRDESANADCTGLVNRERMKKLTTSSPLPSQVSVDQAVIHL